jgi:CsoR family transcriptional regulator, copper-sensing transcriptional repressor
LKTVEGHLRGVIRMVEEDAYCIDVIRQIQAIEAALNKVSAKILEDHLNSCVITAIQGNDKKERERVLKEITEVFEMSTKSMKPSALRLFETADNAININPKGELNHDHSNLFRSRHPLRTLHPHHRNGSGRIAGRPVREG